MTTLQKLSLLFILNQRELNFLISLLVKPSSIIFVSLNFNNQNKVKEEKDQYKLTRGKALTSCYHSSICVISLALKKTKISLTPFFFFFLFNRSLIMLHLLIVSFLMFPRPHFKLEIKLSPINRVN